MNSIKKVLVGVLATFMFSVAAQAETWVIHTEKDFPPYNFTDQGNFTGLDTEIVELVLSELSIEANYKFAAWQDVVKSVDNNSTHLAFQFAPKPERFQKYNMVGPHRIGKTVLAIPADSQASFSNIKDLAGKKVATVDGYSYTKAFDANAAIQKVQSKDNLASLKKLANKEVDFMIGDMNTIMHLAKTNGMGDKIKVLPSVLQEVPRYIAFPKARKADADRFEKKLKELINNGQIDAIIDKWSRS